MKSNQSLSRRVFVAMLTALLGTIVVFALATSVIMHRRLVETTSSELANETRVVAASLNSAPSHLTMLHRLRLDNTRVTLINADGDVLYDSAMDESAMDDHEHRPEIEEALKTGHGSSVRSSSTLDEVMLYEAARLADGSVVRLSQGQASYLTILGSLTPALLILSLVGVVAAVVLSRSASQQIIAPFLEVDLDHPRRNEQNAYTEMVPMLERIESQRQELKRQMRVLADNDRMRREFTANITHELKTPLTTVSGYAELIANDLVPNAEDRCEFGRRIYKEAGRLTSLVNDILTLSNLDEAEHSADDSAGALLGSREPIDLPLLLEGVEQRLEQVAQRAGVTVELRCEPAMVMGVPRLVDEIVYNLASNAIRYNQAGGAVKLTCGMRAYTDATATSKADAAKVVSVTSASTEHLNSLANNANKDAEKAAAFAPFICVSDTGIGIAQEEQSKIFERFYRVDKSRSKARGGTGLGLAIVKHAATFHGATLAVESELGRGTSITVQFPPQKLPQL